MPKNVYSEINLHVTWHTKNNDPVLVDTIENRVFHYLEREVRKMKDVFFTPSGAPKTTFIWSHPFHPVF